MKNLKFSLLIALCALIALESTGCKKNPKGPTPIGGVRKPVGNDGPQGPETTGRDAGTGGTLTSTTLPTTTEIPSTGLEATDIGIFDNHLMDPAFFAGQTVYFDFDKAVVKPSERTKLQTVADRLRADSEKKVLIDGHCDERGTEEYNRSLGERRAQALREYLVTLGIAGNRVRTRSFGEDKPAMDGHDETAWSRNRRGEFILLTPKP